MNDPSSTAPEHSASTNEVSPQPNPLSASALSHSTPLSVHGAGEADQHTEPSEHDVPWAMQLAIFRDRENPASHIDVCEAAATATVSLLADERAEHEWAEPIEHWRGIDIRKVARRADGKRWEDVQALPGVTAGHPCDTSGPADAHPAAWVRAFVPGPVNAVPRAIAKLQVGHTTFPDRGPSKATNAIVRIGVGPGLGMTTGKTAAQCAHAAQRAWETMPRSVKEAWAADAYRVSVRELTPQQWAQDWPVRITDAGFTELDGPTQTTVAGWTEP